MSLENVKYIVLDLNGTLVVENYLRHDEVLESVLKYRRRGLKLTTEDLRKVARGKCTLSEVIARLYVVDDPEDVSRQFLRDQSSRIAFRKKTLDVLKALRRKYGLILCSDTTGIAKEVVNRLGLSRYFVTIFYSCDVGYLKSEEGFWASLLLRFPGARPRDFLVIGDNPRADIYHPKRLGMHTVQIENPLQQSFDYRERSTGSEEEKPEHYLRNLEGVLPLLNL